MNLQFERQVHSATAQFGYDQVRREMSARGIPALPDRARPQFQSPRADARVEPLAEYTFGNTGESNTFLPSLKELDERESHK